IRITRPRPEHTPASVTSAPSPKIQLIKRASDAFVPMPSHIIGRMEPTGHPTCCSAAGHARAANQTDCLTSRAWTRGYLDMSFEDAILPAGLPPYCYHWHEMQHAAWDPARLAAEAVRAILADRHNPLSHTAWGKAIAAGCEMFERATRRYDRPEWGIDRTRVDGAPVAVTQRVVWERPFCKLVHFRRAVADTRAADPKVLLVAPMSGHHATLLRGTVEAFLPDHEVFVTD